ncbi:MAG: response regulator [Sulfurovum sp.]|nr:response regulator [Sulfurovum sp.]
MKILIVDDIVNNREILKDRMVEFNFDIIEAENGESALSMTENENPDLILLDIMMPGMDGFEVCRILKENPSTKDIPIIFLSALNDTSDKVKAFELGAVDYISKPFNGLEVISRIKTHLKLSGIIKEMNQLLKYSFHELYTPLSVIQTSLELQKMEYGATEYLENIQAASLTLQSSYEDIYYSVKKEVTDYPLQWIELEPFLRDRIKYFKPIMQKKSLTCRIHSNVDSPMIHINPTEAKRLFDNLVSNAIKYSDDESEIDICINYNKGEIEILISNYSKLINDASKFFVDLYRENSSIMGFGIGLSLVKQICDRYKIRIKVESEVDRVNIYLTYKEKV